MKKIIIFGRSSFYHYEEAFRDALIMNKTNAIFVRLLSMAKKNSLWRKLFDFFPYINPETILNHFHILLTVSREQPDIVLFWRPISILPVTIKALNARKVCTMTYNNDDPFNPKISALKNQKWFFYKMILRHASHNFFYRLVNCKEATDFGSKSSSLLMSYYIPWIHYSKDDERIYDVVFIGHFEEDGREFYFEAIIKNKIKLHLYGDASWKKCKNKVINDQFNNIKAIHNQEYANFLRRTKISLCFLSKINRDEYTRRCFEIPACGSLLVAERTDFLSSIFVEDKEAVFFSTPNELVEKIDFLLKHQDIILSIAKAGKARVVKDKFDILEVSKQIMLNYKP